MCCVYRLLSSLWDWCVVFPVPERLICYVCLPEGLILSYVYRPWTIDTLCLPSMWVWYIVFTVPGGLIYCVYRPCGADILYLPSLWGWYIVLTIPAGLMYCVCLPSLRGWCIVKIWSWSLRTREKKRGLRYEKMGTREPRGVLMYACSYPFPPLPPPFTPNSFPTHPQYPCSKMSGPFVGIS